MAKTKEGDPKTCGPHQVLDSVEKMCCKKCPKGLGVVIPCANRNGKIYDTECEVCADRKDDDGNILKFLDVEDHVTSCKTCSSCPRHSHKTHSCNGTHNTKCACDKGYFSARIGDEEDSPPICKACRVCPKGTRVAKSCTHTDTLCEECPKETFSPTPNAPNCTPCRMCEYGVKTTRNCSKTEDRACGVTISRGTLNSPSSKNLPGPSNSQGSGGNMIPVYCAIFGAIIVSLIVYVILKRWKLCPGDKKKPSTKTHAKNLPPNNNINNNNHLNSGLLPLYSIKPTKNVGNQQHLITLKCEQAMKPGKSPKKSQGSNLSSISASSAPESQNLLPRCTTMSTGEHLSGSCLDEMERRMKSDSIPGETWVSLSKHLGLKDTVSTRQEAMALGITPMKRLLHKWNMDENSEISSFKRALVLIGFSELTFLVDQDLIMSRKDTGSRSIRQLIL